MSLPFSSLSLAHADVDYLGWTLDITGSTMILTIKISALAFNIYDGSKRVKAFYEQKIKEGHKASRIYQDRIDRSYSHIPNLFEYWGYVFCFTSFFAGPAFEFSEYQKGIASNHSLTADQADQASSSRSTNKDDHWGSRLKAAFGKLGAALLFLAINGALGPKFSLNAVLDPTRKNEYALMNYPFLARLGIAMLCLFVTRCKYYACWELSEGASNVAGYGFKVVKSKPNPGAPSSSSDSQKTAGETVEWSGVSSIDPIGFETASSITDATKAWNIQTQSWLQRYCHTRVNPAFNLYATYSLSAFWHGFYPGYYVSFLSAAILTMCEKEIKAKITPRVVALNNKGVNAAYDLLCRLVVFFMMNYNIMPFVVSLLALVWRGLVRLDFFSSKGSRLLAAGPLFRRRHLRLGVLPLPRPYRRGSRIGDS
jgi:MBOAT, membrane-bound O-acyltransferase family